MTRLRDEMPGTAAVIDDLRIAFGVDEINALIRAGLSGLPTFHATENGRTIGTPLDKTGYILNGTDMVLPLKKKGNGDK